MESPKDQKILNSVKDSYQTIAEDFSTTRQVEWKEFKFFKNYLKENLSILDLGCGNGRLLKFLQDHYQEGKFQYLGIDNSSKLIKLAKLIHPKFEFIEGDLINIPQKDNKFDIVFCIAAFHHLPSKKLRIQALNEVHRVLKKNGIIIITVWNLWQSKYFKENIDAFFKSVFSFGKHKFNDLYIPWKDADQLIKTKRFYHNFMPFELDSLIKKSNFKILENFSVKKGVKVPFPQSYNYIVIAQKND